MSQFRQSILSIAEICARKDVKTAILSPGSRSAPLSLAFLRHPKIDCKTVVDERAAAFIGLGVAQQTRHPVALVCTSGTAALNYASAVAEAFYQQIPLIVFTADRPPEWIAQDDGQTIVQPRLFEPHCNASFELPVDDRHPDAHWHFERILSEAITRTLYPVPGPVHVNVPLREPLYPESTFKYPEKPGITNVVNIQADLDAETWQVLREQWVQAERKLIVAGLSNCGSKLTSTLQRLQLQTGAVLLADVTSNYREKQLCPLFDMVLGTRSPEAAEALQPDLLLTFGGPVVSKHLKLYLRKYKPQNHWHIQNRVGWSDPFQSTSTIVPMSPERFFGLFVERLPLDKSNCASAYTGAWKERQQNANRILATFLQEAPHCELTAMWQVLENLPRNTALQLGNSAIVRLANFLSINKNISVSVNSNRGTCGIDGSVSTAVGAALSSENLTTLITGDLGFFYDRNGLWHDYLPANLRIIIFNNQGGGIFRILDGCRDLPELDRHFEVAHELTAENVAKDHGLAYAACATGEGLARHLQDFFKPMDRAAILEVKFDKILNSEMFLQFKSMLKEIR